MIAFPKIETLFERDKETFKVLPQVRCPEFVAIDRWVVTEKIDGTNIRIDFRAVGEDLEVTIGGRTDKAEIPKDLKAVLDDLVYNLREEVTSILLEYGIQSYTLFGEGYGARIQKGGGRYRDDNAFILFDILVNDRTWLPTNDTLAAAERLGIEHVPVLGLMTAQDATNLVAEGFYSTIATDTEYEAEGVIARPLVTLLDGRGRRVQWKLKTKDFPTQ